MKIRISAEFILSMSLPMLAALIGMPDCVRAQPTEIFVPNSPGSGPGATLELRSEININGSDVHLSDVCRWSKQDGAAFDAVAKLVVAHVAADGPFRAITFDQVRKSLADAGVNLAGIHFSGAMHCTVARTDTSADPQTAMQQWIDMAQNQPATQPAATLTHPEPTEVPGHTLRELLLSDLATRAGLPVESLQLRFNPLDEKILNLSEPAFQFNFESRTGRSLGQVTWDVTIFPHGAAVGKNARITALARAWQDQVVIARPLAYHQIIRDSDLVNRHVLVEDLSSEMPAQRDALVGQIAANELKTGTVMTPRMVDPAPLARPGELVTVIVEQGNVQIRTAARAMESGCYGQTIRARNEATNDVYYIILTAPQMGKMVINGPTVSAATSN